MSKLSKVLLSAQNIIFRIKLQYIFWKKRCIFLLDLFKPQISFMKKIITLLMLICFLISCERKEPNFSDEMIDKIAREYDKDDKIIVIKLYSLLDLYIKTNENEVFTTNANYLFECYKRHYSKKYKTFKIFLEVILDKDYVFDKSNQIITLSPYYKLSPKIEKEYSTLEFDNFFRKYSKQSLRKDELELNTSNLKTNEYFTVKYLLYINKYDVSSDCYLGVDYIRKREDSFK